MDNINVCTCLFIMIWSVVLVSCLDPASTGSESMYAMMKSVPGGNMSAVRSIFQD